MKSATIAGLGGPPEAPDSDSEDGGAAAVVVCDAGVAGWASFSDGPVTVRDGSVVGTVNTVLAAVVVGAADLPPHAARATVATMGAIRARKLVVLMGVLGLAGCGGAKTVTQTTGAATQATTGQAVNVQVTSPADGATVRADRVEVRGTVTPPDADVRVLGQAATVGNGVFTASVPLHRGANAIDVVVSAPGVAPATLTVNVTRPGAERPKPKPKPSSGPSSSSGGSTGGSAPPAFASSTNCGGGLTAGPNTSCPFAENVRAEYNRTGSGVISVFSPVTGRSYTMYCTSGATHVCTGGNNASVYFGDTSGYNTSNCGNGITAGPNTSCSFASNVRDSYYASNSSVVRVFSPVTGRSYTMYCTTGSPHACTGGNNASAYFP